MRIYNKSKDEAIKNIYLFLTIDEARELRDSLNCILRDKSKSRYTRHEHVNDTDLLHEITISVYDENILPILHPRTAKIIKEDV